MLIARFLTDYDNDVDDVVHVVCICFELYFEVTAIFMLFQAFVESNKSIKWCPVAGCGRAVRLPEIEQMHCTTQAKTSHAVDCGNGHFFCWCFFFYF